ncbi:hypothetical protein LIER_10657 [Lithospermum erythrorhizon]|uniref:DYW domain-containing protein n=1 Tax=Lithospermum erythrorhizon TaxID=34254 RepID=A0AAV3PPF3_LITER
MQRRYNMMIDPSMYPILIKSNGEYGIVFHAHLLKLGLEFDKYIGNVMIGLYGKYGPVEDARRLFDEMSERSVFDWNVMISGYWNWGNKEEAEKLFDLMMEKNVVTWTTMVTGYARMKDLDNARKCFDKMPERSVVSWNAMLAGYAQNGLAKEAALLFDDMVDSGVKPNEKTWVSVISACSLRGDLALAKSLETMINDKQIRLNVFIKSALLDMHAKCGNIMMAKKIFDELGESNNSVSWNAMISAYARIGDLTSAKELFDQMPDKNDIVSWNSMIAGYAQNGQSAAAIELFKEMAKNRLVTPDEVTAISVLSACGHLGALGLGNDVIRYLRESQIDFSRSIYNALIFMYSKCGSMKDAENIFYEMKSRDVISYNTLITGFATYGNGKKAVKLLWKMDQEGVSPDRITFIGVLTACSHAGLSREGRKVFKSIQNPDIDHYACMVDLLGRVGELDEAKYLIESMPMAPHAGVYGSLLSASRTYKRIDLGEFAATKLFELEPDNSGNYVLLSNIYASEGRWTDVETIRGLMKTHRVKKTGAWSSVEYKGKMHKFIVGDRSHERSGDIYQILKELMKKMQDAGYIADKGAVLRDVEEEEKEEMVGVHSEKLAIAFALLVSEPGGVIRVVKNLRVCSDCHTAIKIISRLENREIIVRDNNRFHTFHHGICSCNDFW